jgi:tRNA A-37 threonylcarbamoyl transferase component Bud32
MSPRKKKDLPSSAPEAPIRPERFESDELPEPAAKNLEGAAERVRTVERRDTAELAAVRTELTPEPSPTAPGFPDDRFGDFSGAAMKDGKIVLSEEALAAVMSGVEDLKADAGAVPSLAKGVRIAAEYDIRTNNFSTETRIVELPDGRKVFAVHANKASSVHRALDGLMKSLSGLKMRKADRAGWKTAFEAKSNIPVIANDDPNVALMPYLPNVNAYDLFANNKEIKDFGECDWAGRADLEAKLGHADDIVDEIRRLHGQGKVWGEPILPNIIITKDGKPVICDPEIRYDKDVSETEAMARDLKDLIISISGALSRAEGVEDLKPVVTRLLDRYGDEEVIAELKKLASQKRTAMQNLVFGYEQVRSGASSKKEYDAVLAHIREYGE